MTESELPGVNVLIQGATGVGKTHCVSTLVEAGLKRVVYMPFEPGLESLRGAWTDRGKAVPSNLLIASVARPKASWDEMAKAVHYVNTLNYESLKKTGDPNRAKYDQFETFLSRFSNVVTDDGEKLGPVDGWGPDTALVIDGLTGMGVAAMEAVVGGKFDKDQKDWGLAQNMVEGTLRRLCDGCRCHFILLAHIEREKDEIIGGTKITVSTLGAKLAPKIPPMFSDVIMATRIGKEFFWDTENAQADLKTRNLPIAAKNSPDFRTIINKWQSRGGVL